ncbi:MAG: triose-phosphate isomerase [Lachnospiraceae bacterium]|nr:triose-phosphate isomerase [Lachnospiraceae bacterium]
MKKLYFGSNLKMYKGIEETTEYLKDLLDLTADISRDTMELFILPSFTSLPDAVKLVKPQLLTLGAQNMCWADYGQYTGEISPGMLKELGIHFVMAGHSERRHIFHESDLDENRKVKAALSHGFTALLCIGETGEEKEYGISAEVLRAQIKVGLHGITKEEISRIWIAYEPVWSIGVDGTPATSAYAEEMHGIIKDSLFDLFGADALQIPVLYGGSVNAQNANELIVQPSIDGLYIGRAAWDPQEFNTLIRKAMAAAGLLS